MKTLYMVGGTMGVGKTAACQRLKKLLPGAVFLDGDWCWDADPFIVTEETKEMVTDNICHVLRNFLRCGAYENVIFCWVMHEQEILDGILDRLDTEGVRVVCVSLICGEAELRRRLQKDVDAGVRTADVIERSAARIGLYEKLKTVRIDTSGMDADGAARAIARLGGMNPAQRRN